MAGKGHRKKKSGPKAEKRKAAVKQKQGLDDAVDSGLKEPNKRSGALASRGRAVKARARTAEKEQRRLHGAPLHIPHAKCQNAHMKK